MSTGVILVLVLLVLLTFFLAKHFKRLKIDNVYFISGGVKTGKSFVSVALAVKTYRKNLFKWYLTNWLFKLFKKGSEKPMLYSNIPLRYVKFNALTMKVIDRKVRIPNKSVVLIDEISLLADSMLYKDEKINQKLMLFIKLFGHYTHGGTLITNSQAILDCHFSIKRCLSHYLYINCRTKYPLVTIFKAREMLYSADGSSINTSDEDLEESQKLLWFMNRYYKYYDSYCYSVFTDCLPYQCDYKVRVLNRKDSLKADVLLTLQDFSELDRRQYVKKCKTLAKIRERKLKHETA